MAKSTDTSAAGGSLDKSMGFDVDSPQYIDKERVTQAIELDNKVVRLGCMIVTVRLITQNT